MRKTGEGRRDTYENDSFQALSQDCDEWKPEHGVLFCEVSEAMRQLGSGFILGLDGFGNFDSPFVLKLGDAKESSAHYSDDQGGEDTEDALPEIFCFGEDIFTKTVERSDHATAYYDDNCETGPDAIPDLYSAITISKGIGLHNEQ